MNGMYEKGARSRLDVFVVGKCIRMPALHEYVF